MEKKRVGSKNSRAQFSVEYLLVLLAFFGALAVIIPSISFASQQFFSANDTVIAKTIASTVEQDCSLFSFLGVGSKKELSFSVSEKVVLSSNGSLFSIKTSQKDFSFPCKSNSFSFETEKSFLIKIEKKEEGVVFAFIEK